jgi:peptidoglycan/LPS O-acetylase OafA/YrhL
MFFVHTGLVFMWSLERKPHILDFYIRRIFRIYPLAVTAVLVTVLFHIPTLHRLNGDYYFERTGAKNLVSNLLLLDNVIWGRSGPWILGVKWTLPHEVDMYLLMPFLFFFTRCTFVLRPLHSLWGATVVYDRATFVPENVMFAVCIPIFFPDPLPTS